MKIISKKIKSIIIINCFFILCFYYGQYILYTSIYLIFGHTSEMVIVKKEAVNDKYRYYLTLKNDTLTKYSTLPIKKDIALKSIVIVKVVPFFNKVFLGRFVMIGYIIGVILLSYFFFLAIVSFCGIFGIPNKFAERLGLVATNTSK